MIDLLDLPLNIAAREECSIVNGPGERSVIWVQGCPFRCPGCFNEDYLEARHANPMTVRELLAWVQSVAEAKPGFEGVTFSGGEPMAQAKGLAVLSAELQRLGFSIFCYSGYRLEELQANQNRDVQAFIKQIDILVDGRYEREHHQALNWRGSSNQQVHFLTDRYRDLDRDLMQSEREMELIVDEQGHTATGILNQEILTRLTQLLEGRSS